MFRQILVPLDGSEQAERALTLAANIARRADGAVTLMRVVAAEAARGSDAVPVRSGQHGAGSDRQSAIEYLQRMRKSPDLVGVATDVVVRDGSPAEQIRAEAEQHGADLVLLSHRSHRPAASVLFGSVADELMRHTRVPVLVIHADHDTGLEDAASRPVRALVPLDGSTFAEQAIPRAVELLRALETGHGMALHLIDVIDPKLAYRYDTPETQAMHNARAYLEDVAERITADPAGTDVAVSWAVETDAEVVGGIARVAEQGDYLRDEYIDFVAMATHGREGIARWFAGSVTDALAHRIPLPVLVVHPRRDSSQRGGAADATDVTGEAPWPALF